MARKIHGTTRKVKVSREVRAVAARVTQQRYGDPQESAQALFLAGRVFGSRTVTRRMWRALKGLAA